MLVCGTNGFMLGGRDERWSIGRLKRKERRLEKWNMKISSINWDWRERRIVDCSGRLQWSISRALSVDKKRIEQEKFGCNRIETGLFEDCNGSNQNRLMSKGLQLTRILNLSNRDSLPIKTLDHLFTLCHRNLRVLQTLQTVRILLHHLIAETWKMLGRSFEGALQKVCQKV